MDSACTELVLPSKFVITGQPGQLISITRPSIPTASSNGSVLMISVSAEEISGGIRNPWERLARAATAPS